MLRNGLRLGIEFIWFIMRNIDGILGILLTNLQVSQRVDLLLHH